MLALDELVKLDRPTSKAVPYKEWPNLLSVYLEDLEDLEEIIKYNININEFVHANVNNQN